MRVGIDVRAALLSPAGIGRYAAELVRALARLPDPPELALYGDSWRPVALPERAAEFRALGLARLPIPGLLARALAPLGYGVERRLGRVDLFHYTDLVFPPVRRAPTVATVHDLAFEVDASFHGRDFRAGVAPRLRAAVARAARVIAPSRETAEQLERRYGVAAERIAVIPHGSEHALEVAAPPLAEVDAWLAARGVPRPFILCVGTIEPRKNHARLLDAFELFSRQHPHALLIAGRYGWLCDAVRARIAAGGPSRRVFHSQAIGDALLAGLYAAAEFTVYPSLYEGFGLPVLEALAHGAPTIASRAGALGEVAGGAVRSVDPLDVADLARALAELAEQPALRADLAERGRARARTFSWKKAAAAHVSVYRSVLGAREGLARR